MPLCLPLDIIGIAPFSIEKSRSRFSDRSVAGSGYLVPVSTPANVIKLATQSCNRAALVGLLFPVVE